MNSQIDYLIGETIKKVSTDFFEYTICNLCGSNRASTVFTKGYVKVVRCKSCGLTYLNPRLKYDKLLEFYSEGENEEANVNKSVESSAIQLGKDRVEGIKKYKKGGKFLEIGFGSGYTLWVAKECGYETYGVEPSKTGYKHAKNLKLNVHHGTLSDTNFESKYFDVICLYHVLEHVPSPKDDLLEINRILKDDGILVLETPNIKGLRSVILNARWRDIHGAHLYYFSPKTLKKILLRTNFRVDKLLGYGTGLDITNYIQHSAIYIGSERSRKLANIYTKNINILRRLYKPLTRIIKIDDAMQAYASKKHEIIYS